MNTSAGSSRSLLVFFVLIFLFSVPFWPVGVLFNLFLQKDTSVYVVVNLFWHVSLAFMPMIAALILVGREFGWVGVRRHLNRPFDYARAEKEYIAPARFVACPFCGMKNDVVAQFCVRCGKAIPEHAEASVHKRVDSD